MPTMAASRTDTRRIQRVARGAPACLAFGSVLRTGCACCWFIEIPSEFSCHRNAPAPHKVPPAEPWIPLGGYFPRRKIKERTGYADISERGAARRREAQDRRPATRAHQAGDPRDGEEAACRISQAQATP